MKKRNKNKTRIINDFCDAIIKCIHDGNTAPSKSVIITEMIKSNLGANPNPAVADTLTESFTEYLDDYWTPICKEVSAILHMSYHYVNSTWYAEGCQIPTVLEEAKGYLTIFGNGSQRKAAGVRFIIPALRDNDALYIAAMHKKVATHITAIHTKNESIRAELALGSVPPKLGTDISDALSDQLQIEKLDRY